MWSHFTWFIYWLISESTRPAFGSHARIGNYSSLFNPNDCGITRHSIGYEDRCLKWGRNPLPPLKAGRDALDNEVPWMAHIYFNGVGTIHNYSVHLGSGPYSDVNQSSPIDAGYVDEIHLAAVQYSDLGLLKLNKKINESEFPNAKSICLPESHIRPEYWPYVELAMRAGWGQNNHTYQPVQVGYRGIFVVGPNSGNPDWSWQPDAQLLINIYSNSSMQTFDCSGDSGSPLWQYNSGRAVLIGVYYMGVHGADGVCGEPGAPSAFMRVSEFVDWVINVISSSTPISG